MEICLVRAARPIALPALAMPLFGSLGMNRRLSAARCGAALLMLGISFAGCSNPNPDTAAGRAEIAGQKCTLCRAENPGDPAQCYAICMQRIEDQGTYLKTNQHP